MNSNWFPHPRTAPRVSSVKPVMALATLALAALLATTAAHAQVVVSDAWVRGTVAGQTATGAFMKLQTPVDTALVAASSPLAGVVEVHEMRMDAGVMRMSAVRSLAVPAHKVTELKPGGYHVMLMELKRPLSAGDTVPVTLTFEDRAGKRQTVEVTAPVRSLTAAPARDATHKH